MLPLEKQGTFLLESQLFFSQQAKKRRIVPSNAVLDRSRGAACFGNDTLSELLSNYATNTEKETSLKVGLIGK